MRWGRSSSMADHATAFRNRRYDHCNGLSRRECSAAHCECNVATPIRSGASKPASGIAPSILDSWNDDAARRSVGITALTCGDDLGQQAELKEQFINVNSALAFLEHARVPISLIRASTPYHQLTQPRVPSIMFSDLGTPPGPDATFRERQKFDADVFGGRVALVTMGWIIIGIISLANESIQTSPTTGVIVTACTLIQPIFIIDLFGRMSLVWPGRGMNYALAGMVGAAISTSCTFVLDMTATTAGTIFWCLSGNYVGWILEGMTNFCGNLNEQGREYREWEDREMRSLAPRYEPASRRRFDPEAIENAGPRTPVGQDTTVDA